MDQRLRDFYFESKVNTASPGQLLVMLYDALVQQAESAETEIAAPEGERNQAQAAKSISRCLDIITELSSSLKHEYDPGLCATLSNLYCFFAREFSAALEKYDAAKIRAILPLLRELKNSWTQALKLSGQAQLAAA